MAQRRGHMIIELPVAWADDPRSRVRPWRDLPRVLHDAAVTRWNLSRGLYA